MDRNTIPNGPSTSFGDVFPINANALILDLASQSVKSRRRRGNSFDEGDSRIHSESIRITPAHIYNRAPFPSPSRRLFDKSLPLVPAKNLFKTTSPLRIAKMSMAHPTSEGMELIHSGCQNTRTPLAQSDVNVRRKRNKALGHALRKSRDLRNTKELSEMLGRPLPPLPPVDPADKMAIGLADSPLELPEPPCRPKRSPARLAVSLPSTDKDLTDGNSSRADATEDDDWATFISRGYALFPQPPSHRPVPSSSNRSRLAARKQAKRLSANELASPQTSMASAMMKRSKTVPQKTGIDWLDDELAWVSSDDEREELCKAMTPPELPISTFTAGLGLTRSLSTPPSSSVDTFPGSDSSVSIYQTPSQLQQLHQQKNKWRMSGVSDVFVTPTASPQIDLGTLTMNNKDGKTISVVKRAHLPMFTGLADAVPRYAAEAAGLQQEMNKDDKEEEEEGNDQFDAIVNRHDSISSVTSSSAMSRDFSSATTVSTRPSSVAGVSECGSTTSWARSPTSQARMKQLSTSRSSRVGSVDGAEFSFSPPSTTEKLNHCLSTKHHRKQSDASSSGHSKSSRRRRGSKVPWPQEGSAPPPTPVRTASLQAAQAEPSSNAGEPERPLLGSWLSQGERFEPRPIKQSDASSSTVAFDLSSTSTIHHHRQVMPSRSTHDLTQSSSQAPPVAKSGLRSLFARQRRQSTSNVLDNKSQSSLVPSIRSNESTNSADRANSSQLADRILAKMGGGNSLNVLDLARPLADVPVTPTTTGDEPAPQSCSPSQKIFGSASFTPAPGFHQIRQSIDQDRMTAADGLRAFAEASSASRRTSTISTNAMPSQLAGHRAYAQGNAASLSRATSLRSRIRGLVFDYDPSSPFYVYDGDEQIPVNTVKTPTTSRQKQFTSTSAPPVTFWRRGGARALSSCDPFKEEEGDQTINLDRSQDSIQTLNGQSVTPVRQQCVRRKSSFNLWK